MIWESKIYNKKIKNFPEKYRIYFYSRVGSKNIKHKNTSLHVGDTKLCKFILEKKKNVVNKLKIVMNQQMFKKF